MLATFALILSVFVMNSPQTQDEPGGASLWGLLAQLGSSSWLAYLPAAVRIHLGLSTQMNDFVDKGWQSWVFVHQKGGFVDKGWECRGSIHRKGDFVEERALEPGSDLRSCYATLSLKKLQIDKKKKNLHVWCCAHAVFFALLWGGWGEATT